MEGACDLPRDAVDPGLGWDNPYRAPAVPSRPADRPVTSTTGLAPRSARLAAVLIDHLCLFAAVTPSLAVFVYLARTSGTHGLEPLFGGAVIISVVALSVVQIALLIGNGQTIGKNVMRIRIVDHEDRSRTPWTRAVGVRYLLNFALGQIPFYFVVDVAFIFGPERRCLHDRLSRTTVVEADA